MKPGFYWAKYTPDPIEGFGTVKCDWAPVWIVKSEFSDVATLYSCGDERGCEEPFDGWEFGEQITRRIKETEMPFIEPPVYMQDPLRGRVRMRDQSKVVRDTNGFTQETVEYCMDPIHAGYQKEKAECLDCKGGIIPPEEYGAGGTGEWEIRCPKGHSVGVSAIYGDALKCPECGSERWAHADI
jgi:hypothetical protein